MNKQDIKNILFSLRDEENSPIVNNLLGKIYMMDESSLEEAIVKVGGTEEKIRAFLQEKINNQLKFKQHPEGDDKRYPLNKMYTYGVGGRCIHLHLPGQLGETMERIGRDNTLALVNRNLIDALERVKELKDSGRIPKDIDSVFMISHSLIRSELDFLRDLDFVTEYFNRKDLANEDLAKENHNLRLAIEKFGKDGNVGCATLPLEKMYTQDWQDKKEEKKQELDKVVSTIEEPDVIE